jgi:predicted nucleotidyltransferase
MNDDGQRGAPHNNEGVASRPNALEMARSIVADRYPDALAAVLAGSYANGTATATSDLDIVVLLSGPPAPYRETIRVEDIPVELFVHTSDSQLSWYERERSEGRCTLAHMLATGIAVAGPETEATQAAARRWVARGPELWTEEQLEQRRYALTDALDDLVGAREPDERDAVAGQVLLMVAELALNLRVGWQGRGKWMVRQLRATDAGLAEELMSAHREAVATGQVSNLVKACEAVLNEAGGRLTEGFSAR